MSKLSGPSKALFDELFEQFADAVAEKIVQRMQSGPGTYVDQSTSPLGRRRHIAAIRSGKLPGTRVGRQYLARAADVEAFVRSTHSEVDDSDPVDTVDELAVELGLGKSRSGG